VGGGGLKVSAVIPAYNERESLQELTDRLHHVLSEWVGDFTILYVYQGDDGGDRVLEELRRAYPEVSSLVFPRALGVGYAYRLGFQGVDGASSHILTMDADLNHEPEAIPSLLEKAKEADVVIGSRYVKGGSWEELHPWKKFFSPVANGVLRRAFSIGVSDFSSGFRLYRTDVVKAILPELVFRDYEFYPESIILAARRGFRLEEVPIVYRRRRHGVSKIRPLATGLGYLRLLLALRRRGGEGRAVVFR
jgi:dolichol-phosphate mannosyltransferase